MQGMQPARILVDSDIDGGLVEGIAIVGKDATILFHVIAADHPDNESGEQYYGITLLENDGAGTPIMALGILGGEAEYKEVVRVIAHLGRGAGPHG